MEHEIVAPVIIHPKEFCKFIGGRLANLDRTALLGTLSFLAGLRSGLEFFTKFGGIAFEKVGMNTEECVVNLKKCIVSTRYR